MKKIKKLSKIKEKGVVKGFFGSSGYWFDHDLEFSAKTDYEKLVMVANKTGLICKKINEIIEYLEKND